MGKRRRATALRTAASAPSPWTLLPDEVTIMIFDRLDMKSLVRAGTVCRAWRRVSADDRFWAQLVQQVKPAYVPTEGTEPPAEEEDILLEDDSASEGMLVGALDRVHVLSLLSAPRRPGDKLHSRIVALNRVSGELHKRKVVSRVDEFAHQPSAQVIGMQTVSDSVVTLSSDGYLRAYNVETLEQVGISRHAHHSVPVILVREDVGEVHMTRVDRLAVSLDAQRAYVWHLPSLELRCVLPHAAAVSARLTRDWRFLATWSDEEGIVWDLRRAMQTVYGVPDTETRRIKKRRHGSNSSGNRGSGSGGASHGSRLLPQHGQRIDEAVVPEQKLQQAQQQVQQQTQQQALQRRKQKRLRRRSSSEVAEVQSRHRSRSKSSSRPGNRISAVPARLALPTLSSVQRVRVHVSLEAARLGPRRTESGDAKYAVGSDFETCVKAMGFILDGERAVIVMRHMVEVWMVADSPAHLMLRHELPYAPLLAEFVISPGHLRVYAAATELSDNLGEFHRIAVSLVTSFTYEAPSTAFTTGAGQPWLMYDGFEYWTCDDVRLCSSSKPGTWRRPYLHGSTSGGNIPEAHRIETTLDSSCVPWWNNQRIHFVGVDSIAYISGGRNVHLFKLMDNFAEPIVLKHFPYGEYPFDLAEPEDTIVSMALALPYVFTAGGPNHSIKRWDLLHARDIQPVHQRGLRAVPSKAVAIVQQGIKAWHKADEDVLARMFAVLCLAAYVLWQVRLDGAIDIPYTLALAPLWITALLFLEFAFADVINDPYQDSIQDLVLELFAVVGLVVGVVYLPLSAALKADGIIGWAWWVITIPIHTPLILGTLGALIVQVVEGNFIDGIDVLVTLMSLLYCGSLGSFVLAHAISVDYPDAAPIPSSHTWWFIWGGLMLMAGVYVLFVALSLVEPIVELICNKLDRTVPGWAIGFSAATPWDIDWHDSDIWNFSVIVCSGTLLVFGTQFMLYQKLVLGLPRPWSVALIPVDIVVLMGLVGVFVEGI